jgi:hypothetical protein
MATIRLLPSDAVENFGKLFVRERWNDAMGVP